MVLINQHVLMSDADYFTDEFAINAYMDSKIAVDTEKAKAEHLAIQTAFEAADIHVVKVRSPKDCQDGVYTANWAITRGERAVLSSLPPQRRGEMPYARTMVESLGKEVFEAPLRFSGQGDALPCGDLLFMGTGYRTDPGMHAFVAGKLGYQVIGLQTVPALDSAGQPVINPLTKWPDSFFYDLDLALAVLRTDLIAWCPQAFTPESQAKIRALTEVEKIEVSYEEATKGFACNLVSTGETVIMSAQAPKLKAAVEAKGLKTITPYVTELAKGGGYIRCVSLTLDNG